VPSAPLRAHAKQPPLPPDSMFHTIPSSRLVRPLCSSHRRSGSMWASSTRAGLRWSFGIWGVSTSPLLQHTQSLVRILVDSLWGCTAHGYRLTAHATADRIGTTQPQTPPRLLPRPARAAVPVGKVLPRSARVGLRRGCHCSGSTPGLERRVRFDGRFPPRQQPPDLGAGQQVRCRRGHVDLRSQRSV
jgi:hypothetical protein